MFPLTFSNRSYECLAALDSGQVVRYDACQSAEDYAKDGHYEPSKYDSLGVGVIHMIDGVPQNGTKKCVFYKRHYRG